MSSQRIVLDKLLEELSAAFRQEGRPGGDLAAIRLLEAKQLPYRGISGKAAPEDLVSGVASLPDALSIARLVLDCGSILSWENWEGDGLENGVSANLFSTELVGPDGHFYSKDVRVGLLISDANTDYPASNHSGEETYFILSGHAEWTLNHSPYKVLPPGSYVHHPSWEIHGRRTRSEPFLGAWRWSGDLDLSSFSVQ